jgi:hypothetical protein
MHQHDLVSETAASGVGHLGIRLVGGAPLHTLYLGSPHGAGFSAAALEAIEAVLSSNFSGFTLLPATGFYNGTAMPTLVAHIATKDTCAVHAAARQLGKVLGQKAVGLQLMGQFYTIEMD